MAIMTRILERAKEQKSNVPPIPPELFSLHDELAVLRDTLVSSQRDCRKLVSRLRQRVSAATPAPSAADAAFPEESPKPRTRSSSGRALTSPAVTSPTPRERCRLHAGRGLRCGSARQCNRPRAGATFWASANRRRN
jgi:hypothetical protein